MLLSQINPFIRYARILNLDSTSVFNRVAAPDARLFYTLDGQGKIKVKNREYDMTPHSLLIINSGVPYHIITPETFVNYIALNFDYTQTACAHATPIIPVPENAFNREMLVDFCSFQDTPMLSEAFYLKEISSIQKNLSAIVREYAQTLLYFDRKMSHLLAQCIIECIRFFDLGNMNIEKETAGRIISYIHDNFHKNITNRSISEVFGYHPNYISRLVKKLTGMPIHQYIIHVRLTNAANLLEHTSLQCDEIAAACGFCDSAYFSRYFKRHFGVNPTRYRNI